MNWLLQNVLLNMKSIHSKSLAPYEFVDSKSLAEHDFITFISLIEHEIVGLKGHA